jgi:Na+-translocating ferredoxin:NAD+ oxidoreductase RnfC subunit
MKRIPFLLLSFEPTYNIALVNLCKDQRLAIRNEKQRTEKKRENKSKIENESMHDTKAYENGESDVRVRSKLQTTLRCTSSATNSPVGAARSAKGS